MLQHHQDIEEAFEEVRAATDANAQKLAERRLATLLTGHSMAEEAVLYPALASADQKRQAVEAYTQQSAAKLKLGVLETLAPMSEDYVDKLEHIRHAVALHVYQEESTWFLELARTGTTAVQARLSARYLEEFERYMGPDAGVPAPPRGGSQRTAWPMGAATPLSQPPSPASDSED